MIRRLHRRKIVFSILVIDEFFSLVITIIGLIFQLELLVFRDFGKLVILITFIVQFQNSKKNVQTLKFNMK